MKCGRNTTNIGYNQNNRPKVGMARLGKRVFVWHKLWSCASRKRKDKTLSRRLISVRMCVPGTMLETCSSSCGEVPSRDQTAAEKGQHRAVPFARD